MRVIFNLFLLIAGFSSTLISCDKTDALQQHQNGAAPDLGASTVNIVTPPADSNKVALTLAWSDAKYATETSHVKYTIEIDSAGKNFANASTWVTNGLNYSFIGKDLNNMLLARGYAFNVPVTMDVRVTSSYANNNQKLASNVIKIRMTPYKIPPKVALPTSNRLFIVGGATQGGWNNPVPLPSQELTRIDETTWGGFFQLTGNQSYLLLPVNGDWGTKFGGTAAGNNSNNPLGDDFKVGGSDLIAPATGGWYKMIVNFQTGKFSLTPFTQQHGLPTELFIVGDATPGGWNNPVPTPSQQFTRLTSTKFELASIALTSGKKYLFLPENGNWGKKFGDDGSAANTKLIGTFKPEGADFSSPDVTGNYKITVDFINNTYTLVKL